MKFDLEQEQLLLRRRLEVIARMTAPEVQDAIKSGYGPDTEAIQDELVGEYPDTCTRDAFLSRLSALDGA